MTRADAVERATAGLASLLEHLPARRPSLVVLTYHRVAPADERPDLHPGLRVDPDVFSAQLDVVTRHAQPVSCDDLLAARAGDRHLPARAVHVTLDDAYGCTERHAWPRLRRAGVPATLFVPTAYPDAERTFWWDRLHHALRAAPGPLVHTGGELWPVATPGELAFSFAQLRARVAGLPHDEAMAVVDRIVADAGAEPAPGPDVVGWIGLAAMAAEGLALAPHSRTHPRLVGLPPDRLDDEVAGSWADLVARCGRAARPLFAPPGGAVDDAVVAAARRAGLDVVMTTERGVNDGEAPEWSALRRINVGPRATAGLVRVQLHPASHRARAAAHAARARVGGPPAARRGGGRSWS